MRLVEEGLTDPFDLMEMYSPEHVPSADQSTCEDTSTKTADSDCEGEAGGNEGPMEEQAESASDQGT